MSREWIIRCRETLADFVKAERRGFTFGHDEGQERSAQPHEKADENIWDRGWNGNAKDQITAPCAEGSRDVEIRCPSVGNARGGQHRYRKPDGERNQRGRGNNGRGRDNHGKWNPRGRRYRTNDLQDRHSPIADRRRPTNANSTDQASDHTQRVPADQENKRVPGTIEQEHTVAD